MPLLNDAKTCYVGTTPITKIYAGTQLVWGALELRAVNFSVPGLGAYLGVEFAEREECVDCAAMTATYQFRYYSLGAWTPWQPFTGYRINNNGFMAYIPLGAPSDSRFQDSIFQLRKNGSIEQITLNVTSVPNVGAITPELTC